MARGQREGWTAPGGGNGRGGRPLPPTAPPTAAAPRAVGASPRRQTARPPPRAARPGAATAAAAGTRAAARAARWRAGRRRGTCAGDGAAGCPRMRARAACWLNAEIPHVWDAVRRAAEATVSRQAAQAALRGAWERPEPLRHGALSSNRVEAAIISQLCCGCSSAVSSTSATCASGADRNEIGARSGQIVARAGRDRVTSGEIEARSGEMRELVARSGEIGPPDRARSAAGPPPRPRPAAAAAARARSARRRRGRGGAWAPWRCTA